jgi:hypothetical protein
MNEIATQSATGEDKGRGDFLCTPIPTFPRRRGKVFRIALRERFAPKKL